MVDPFQCIVAFYTEDSHSNCMRKSNDGCLYQLQDGPERVRHFDFENELIKGE